VKEETHGVSPEGSSYCFQDFLVFPSISHQKTPAVCPCDGQAGAFPLFNGSIEAKKVLDPFPEREGCLAVGSVKIDNQNLVLNDKEIFKLEVVVVKTGLMKLCKETPCRSYRFSLMEEVSEGRVRAFFLKILDQVFSVRDL
jgi:hypothetical protein